MGHWPIPRHELQWVRGCWFAGRRAPCPTTPFASLICGWRGHDRGSYSDPAVIKATLRVQEREGYWWIECSMCDCWQVPYFAAETVG